jgi:RNA polymerase sigma factor (sigma-70 family)
MTDRELLAGYVAEGSGEAFAELVRRYIDLVYGVALRQVCDAHLAEDVAQAVFLLLAQKARAGRLGSDVVLAGWLFRTARFVGANANKREVRRHKREVATMRMNPRGSLGAVAGRDRELAAWELELAPALDGALSKLGSGERDAVLLRFLQGMELPEVAQVLGVSADAARKRIERGLVKLRRLLGAAGVAAPSVAALLVVLSEHAASAAPVGLAGTVASSIGSGAGGEVMALAQGALMWAKAKVVAFVAVLVVVGTTAGVVVHEKLNRPARAQVPVAQVPVQPVVQVPAPAKPQAAPQTVQIQGVVLAPDETPAAGAEVFVAMPEDPTYAAAMRLYEARVSAKENVPPNERPIRKQTQVDVYKAWPAGTQTTDAMGRFTYDGVKEPWVLVVRHPSGYAEVSDEQFKKSKGQVWVKPYGKVEGTLLKGAQPQALQKVMLFRYQRGGGWDEDQIRHDRFVTTDDQGKFVFENVCPGEDLWLAWERPLRIPITDQHTLINVEAGRTVNQDVGGRGRAVVGRAATIPANAPDQRLNWSKANRTTSGVYTPAGLGERFLAAFKPPPGYDQMPREEQKKYERQFFKSPAGSEMRPLQWGREIDLRPDGSFRLDDVLPGKYLMYFRIYHLENGFGEDVVDCRTEFTVPELPPGATRIDQPLDLGTIPATLKPRALVGTQAPEFEARGLDGKVLKLSDFRGKYVFLKHWYSSAEIDIEAPAIKKAWDLIKGQDDWVLINIGFDKDIETTRKRVADHQLPGIHCQFEDTGKFPRAYTGSPSTIHIIGPDGKVLARNIQPLEAESIVAMVLLEKR